MDVNLIPMGLGFPPDYVTYQLVRKYSQKNCANFSNYLNVAEVEIRGLHAQHHSPNSIFFLLKNFVIFCSNIDIGFGSICD